ncbi:GNAT family N-acetyltransferase [Streptomyces sp. UNOC14_S4]|uniref:GNAT family N-acetyltransferase n=1 Tax=Streptomyces sp. UNOC14_S4 TaxID=2872340 RepID=UPI001E6494F7|nr:GNAT family N-acetyltransferase [Streptomyces sp. UNOC14_S4]
MIEFPGSAAPAAGPWATVPFWFASGHPGLGVLPEHVRSTGHGRWWADHPVRPRAAAVSCAGHVILGGDPRLTRPGDLTPLAHSWIAAPDRFLPLLGAAFERIVPWERMIWVHDSHVPAIPAVRVPPGVTVRRLTPRDAEAVQELGPELAWIAGSWGGPHGLAACGRTRAAFHGTRLLSLACTYYTGSRYEDVAVVTRPEGRGRGLAAACVRALCTDITARGRTATWTCSRDNHPSRGLAEATGFRLYREYVHYAVGAPAHDGGRQPRRPALR